MVKTSHLHPRKSYTGLHWSHKGKLNVHTLAFSCSKIKKNLKEAKNQRAAKQDSSRAKKGAESPYYNMPTAEEQKQREVTAWLLLVEVHKTSTELPEKWVPLSFTDSPAATALKEAPSQSQEKRAWKKPPHKPWSLLLTSLTGDSAYFTTGRLKSCPLAAFYSSSLINGMKTYW